MQDIEQGLKTDVVQKQLEIIRLHLRCILGLDDVIDIKWVNNNTVAHLKGTLKPIVLIDHIDKDIEIIMSY
jgi:sucrose phosphorylase